MAKKDRRERTQARAPGRGAAAAPAVVRSRAPREAGGAARAAAHGGEHAAGDEIHLPAPSVWPFVFAGGLTLALFGILTSLGFTVVGVVITAVALGGWIGELRHE